MYCCSLGLPRLVTPETSRRLRRTQQQTAVPEHELPARCPTAHQISPLVRFPRVSHDVRGKTSCALTLLDKSEQRLVAATSPQKLVAKLPRSNLRHPGVRLPVQRRRTIARVVPLCTLPDFEPPPHPERPVLCRHAGWCSCPFSVFLDVAAHCDTRAPPAVPFQSPATFQISAVFGMRRCVVCRGVN